MPIALGSSDLGKLHLGSNKIDASYLGGNLVFSEQDLLLTVDASISTSLTVSNLNSLASYSGVIDWGDGSADTILSGTGNTSISHTFTSTGVYQVRVSGSAVPRFGLNDQTNVVSVENFGNVGLNDTGNMFNSCTNLASVKIGNNLNTLGNNTFYNCTNLTSIIMPHNVTTIGIRQFELCSSLVSINLPYNITSIGYRSFYNCTGLTSVTIPDSVTSIGNDAFYSCSGLTSIIIPDSVTSIGGQAFNLCSSLTSITIPDSVTRIENGTFTYCTSLTSVTIGNSVTSIGAYAFTNCSSLTSIVVAADNPNYSSMGPLLLNKNGTEVITGPGASGDFTIPNNVTSIKDFAFYFCTGLTSITIGNSVTSIGDFAFENCTGLTSVTIGNSVETIGGYAFSFCFNLAAIDLSQPKSVIDAAPKIFQGTASPLTLNVPTGTTGWTAGTGQSIGGNTNVTVNLV